MIILESERQTFKAAMNQIRQSFKARENSIEGIGGDTIGLPLLMAQFDLEESGTTSGAWLRHTENALSIGYGLRVLHHLDRFVGFAESLVKAGATSPDQKVETNGTDQYCYCTQEQEVKTINTPDWGPTELVYDYHLVWMETQSSAFCYRLSKVKKEEPKTIWINEFSYSAREISSVEFFNQKLNPERFRYNDSRDSGYCGTLKRGCAPEIHYCYLAVSQFKNAFNRLFFNVQEDPDE